MKFNLKIKKQKILILILLIQILTFCNIPSAVAEEKYITRLVEFYTQTSDAKPVACGTQLTYIFLDQKYTNGNMAGLTASFTNIFRDGKAGMILKLRGYDFDKNGTATSRKAFSISSVSVNAQGKVLRPQIVECESEKSFCGVYTYPDSGVVSIAMNQPSGIILNFKREGGLIDYNFKADLSPDPAQDIKKYGKELGQSGECSLSLLNGMNSFLKK